MLTPPGKTPHHCKPRRRPAPKPKGKASDKPLSHAPAPSAAEALDQILRRVELAGGPWATWAARLRAAGEK